MDEKHIEEAPLLKVARMLREQGFDPANCAGYALSQEDIRADNQLGILVRQAETKTFFGFISLRQRRKFIGSVWFRGHGANSKTWILEVFGRDSILMLQPAADLIAQTCNVKVKLKLVTEIAREESYPRDGDM